MSELDGNNDLENVLVPVTVILGCLTILAYWKPHIRHRHFNAVALRHRSSGGDDDGLRGCILSEKAPVANVSESESEAMAGIKGQDRSTLDSGGSRRPLQGIESTHNW